MTITYVSPTTLAAGNATGGANSPVCIKFSSSANDAQTFALGFNPSQIWVYNDTDDLLHEWFREMPAASTLKHTGSTGVFAVVDTNGFTVADGVVTMGTEIILASKTYYARFTP